ncbi:MAG: hypothetical protein JWQ57_5148 [Mucilaginibacter sp.]|nr:hypothetical protein [Mucilaginibacter sp.]
MRLAQVFMLGFDYYLVKLFLLNIDGLQADYFR